MSSVFSWSPRLPWRSPPAPSRPCRPVARRARTAVSRSTQPVTSAPAATATRTDGRLLTDTSLEKLRNGRLEITGRLVDASNATFLCSLDGHERVVYKPVRGERPLDDFPPRTLAKREVAAYVLSEATGWQIVPPTVMRDGPFGPGAVQLWVDVDREADVLAMVIADDPRFRRMCVFDVIANNADRKGSHVLPMPDGHVYGVDHGLCFAVEPKLRTVLWGWRGQSLNDDELSIVSTLSSALDDELGRSLSELLTPDEVAATASRAQRLLRTRRFPEPAQGRPALPWPPFALGAR